MSQFREQNSDRLHASLRGLLPMVVTPIVLVIVAISLSIVFDPTATAFSLVESVENLGYLLSLTVALVVLLSLAVSLDRKPISVYGLETS